MEFVTPELLVWHESFLRIIEIEQFFSSRDEAGVSNCNYNQKGRIQNEKKSRICEPTREVVARLLLYSLLSSVQPSCKKQKHYETIVLIQKYIHEGNQYIMT